MFSKPAYLCAGDPYQEKKNLNLRERPKTSRDVGRGFKPSFNGSKIVTSEFEHFKDYEDKTYTKWLGPG